MSSEEPSPKADIAIDLVANLAAAGAGLAVGGVSGALTAAAAAPIASDVLRRIRTRREEKVEAVIKFAAKRAGISADSLIERLEQGSESEQLFVRTVQAAQDKAEISHLMALGESLAAADRSGYSLDRLTFETAFVRAMAECDTSHVRLLRAFTTAYDDLRLDPYREWRAQPFARDG